MMTKQAAEMEKFGTAEDALRVLKAEGYQEVIFFLHEYELEYVVERTDNGAKIHCLPSTTK